MSETKVACAIYTRKSTSEGLAEDFTSLDAQRESAESYIQSQKSQGWLTLPSRYDDGGFTGANMERPALQVLMDDIRAGKINCVIVYKVDRLSRSLLDFVKLLQFFEDHKVAFVSVTQHFNTNTSMGRLTLNILLSFAQFEREIISERTRDKMGAARRKGKWVGGRPALGYDLDVKNHRLVVNSKEAEYIRLIFELYLQEKSLLAVAKIVNKSGIRTKVYLRKGKPSGGFPLTNTNVQLILKNRLYTGKIFYRGEIFQGQHEAIVSEDVFNRTNEILTHNRRERGSSRNTKNPGLLSGLLRCADCGVAMCHTYARKGNKKYLYYLCLTAIKRDRKKCPAKSLSADKIETAALDCLRKQVRDSKLGANWPSLLHQEKIESVRSHLKGLEYSARNSHLRLNLKDNRIVDLKIDLKELKHTAKPDKIALAKEPELRQKLVLAHQVERLLERGQIDALGKVTGHLNLAHARMNQLLAMTLLSPAIQEDILLLENDRIDRIPEYKLRPLLQEHDWQKQGELWRDLLPSSVG